MSSVESQFGEGLAQAQAQLHRVRIRSAISLGLNRGVVCGATAIAMTAMTALLLRLAGASVTPAQYGMIVAIAAGAFAVPLLASVFPAIRNKPSLEETAERLDLATGNHNRVASALDLARRGSGSEFAQAAIVHGLESLNWVRAQPPAVPVVQWQWKRNAAVIGGAFAVATALLMAPVRMGAGESTDPRQAVMITESLAGGPTPKPATQPTRQPEDARPDSLVNRVRKSSSASEKSTSAVGGNAIPSIPAQAAAGSSSTAQQQGPESSKPADKKRTPNPDENDPPSVTASATSSASRQSPPSDARGTSAKSASGGKGSSAQPTLGLEGDKQQSRENAEDGGRDAESEEEIDADKPNESEHRGGMRPVLQDRQQSPTRDLGMTGSNKGPPGNGRGGPTPPKKSRGAGSLLLGVPVPDFIQGRLLPGISRLSRQMIPPQRQPGEPAAGAETAYRTVDEPPVDRFDIPTDSRDAVERYFIRLHRDPDSDQPSSAASDATTTREIAP